MSKYRKKPVVVEAMQLGSNWAEVKNWIVSNGGDAYLPAGPDLDLAIRTLEGEMRALPGDWIIRGIKGEFYPCKPDIFAATYEAAKE